VVLYAAGLTDVDACERDPALAWRLNAEVSSEIASWGGARVVYFSTDYVFDGARGLYSEDDGTAPVNVYGRSKVAGERAVLGSASGNLVVRLSGLYDANGVKEQAFSSPPPPAPSDDTRMSSPVHVEDVVSAIRLLLGAGTRGVYHVAGPGVLSRYEFGQLVALRSPARAVAPPRGGAAPRPRDSSLLASRVKGLGWTARRVSEGLTPLPISRPAVVSSARALRLSTEALLIDCVGGLLTHRRWLSQDGSLLQANRACAATTNGYEFWQTAGRSPGIGEGDYPDLHERIFRYARILLCGAAG
jgi:dTDP-4-dehydrorhamnose reductase